MNQIPNNSQPFEYQPMDNNVVVEDSLSLKIHLQRTWDRLVPVFGKLLLLFLISVMAYGLVTFIIVGIGFVVTIQNPEVTEAFSSYQVWGPGIAEIIPSWYLIFMTGLIVVLSILFTIINLIYSAANVLIIDKSDQRPSLRESIGNGFGLLIPLFIMYLFFGLIAIGNMVLLFVPGLLVLLFGSFAIMSLVLDNTGAIDSIKKSFQLVRDNFNLVLGRVVLFGLAWIIISSIVQSVLNNPTYAGIGVILWFIANIMYPWFVFSYYIVLYRFVRGIEKTPSSPTRSFNLSIITGLIGWMIIIVSGFSIYNYIKEHGDVIADEFMKTFQQQMLSEDLNLDQFNENPELLFDQNFQINVESSQDGRVNITIDDQEIELNQSDLEALRRSYMNAE